MGATVGYCGEIYIVDPEQGCTIGRAADVVIDDNPFLHRRFLTIRRTDGLWWLRNVGSHLVALVSDPLASVEQRLAPGGRVPLVSPVTLVRFTAGSTTYEFEILLDDAASWTSASEAGSSGATTLARVTLTPSQHLLVLALAEPRLRSGRSTSVSLPSSAEAAARLGWRLSRFNRKLDNVCEKLSRLGVRGLHGEPSRLASNRRASLVDYAIAVRMVTVDDLRLLDELDPAPTDDPAD